MMRRLGLPAAVLLAALLPAPVPASAHPAKGPAHRPAVSDTASPTFVAPPRPPAVRPQERVVATASTAGAAGATTSRAATDGSATAATAASTRSGSGLVSGGRALVLYDSTGPYAWLGEVYATQAVNLASHFGSWAAHPVTAYTAGELSKYTAVIYIGSTYDEPVPTAFLDDVLASTIPVTWVYDNIWQLTARSATFAQTYGFTWRQFDFSSVAEVRYKATSLTRYAANGAGIMDDVVSDTTKAQVLASAVRSDGTTFPWAVRSGQFTYVGEIPFAYTSHDDRYLAFADLMFDALAPATPTRHRALVRIEDVSPDSDPTELRAVADYLSARTVPFTVAVFPEYRDPLGAYNNGVPVVTRLRDTPTVVSALKYMKSKGGTIIMHGYTHQYASTPNPYTGASGDDFEFFLAHVDADNYVRYDGPTAEDSATWAKGRIDASAAAFTAAGLARPTIFEFPHYAGSAVDYSTVASQVGTRYDRGLYPPGVLNGGTVDYTRVLGQFFPYSVRDVYGSAVVPENLGNVELEESNHNPPRLPADILASAQRNLVVRDGVASFFYHPFLGTSSLSQIVEGLQTMGYSFIPASASLTS